MTTIGLVSLFAISGGLGYLWSGLGGAFFVGLGVTTVVGVGLFARKIRAQDRTRMVETAPNLDGLGPARALSVMGAMTGTDGAMSFKSELLTKLESIDERLEEDPTTALSALEPLLADHPRSPAAHLRHARALRASVDDTGAARAASTALRHALDGGMNPMASAVYIEFEALHESLNLEDRHRQQLARALEVGGHDEAAAKLTHPS